MYQLEGLQKEIFEKKYRNGDTETIQGMWHRVAKAVASVEKDAKAWTKEFEDLLSDFKFIPGGRVSAGAGTKNNYLLNCATLPIEDSIDGIYETVKKAAVMAKCQYGTGFDFSTIRPKNDAVTKGGTASGPVSFMKVFDASGAIIETGGCFAEGTLVNTNRGLVPVEQVVADPTIEYAVTHKGLRRITARFDNGMQPVLTVTTNNGYSVTTTPTHKFKQFNAEGGFDDVLAKDLKPGDRVPLLASSVEVGTATKLQTRFEYIELPGCTTLNRDVALPTEMCEDFAYFIGFMLGNGYIDADKRIQLSVSNTYPDVVTQLCRISETLFGLTPIVTPGDGKCTVVCVYSAYLVEYLRVNGLGKAKAAEIKVPEMFFTETPTNISAFVAGYFDADGHQPVTKAQRTFASVSKPLLVGIQQLLLQLGVFCTVAVNRPARNAWKTLYRLSVPNNEIGARFYLATSKYSKKVVNLNPRGCSKQFVYTRFTPKSLGAVDKEFRGLATGNHNISHSTLCKLAERSQVVKDLSLEYVVEDTIVSVVSAGSVHVYDIEVEDLHLVSGNGFYTSNSRRAAAIGVLRVDHPDIFEFIEAKREQGVLTNFNISVGITQPFLDAVKADQNFDLVFNGKVYRTVKASEIWDKLVSSAYNFNDPGLLMLDEVNKYNNGYYLYEIGTTNPCGEIPLPPYGVCDLGNLNLTKYVIKPFADWNGLLTNFNKEAYVQDIRTAVRFLDNILDVSEYPYDEIAKRAQGDRRIGLNGVAGYGSFLAMLRVPYDSTDAVEIASTLQYWCMCEAYQASIELAKEKGVFPNFDAEKYLQAEFIQKLPPHIKEGIKQHGIRNLALLTIPPVGTGSLLAGNISNGLEPIFALEYNRKVRQLDQSLKDEAVEDYAWKLFKQLPEYLGSGANTAPPAFFKTSREIASEAHINVQAAFQEFIDGSISKTVNMPEATTLKDYEDVLWYAIKSGCKGFTSFREGTREGVLSTKEEGKKEHKPAAEETIKAKEPKKKRQRILAGKTYKVADDKGNLYVTINDITERGKTRPFEIFINSNGENSEYSQWYRAIGKLMSAVMRRTDDCSFMIKDLQSIFSVNGYFSDGRYLQSQPQMIGNILEEHIRSLHPEEAKDVKYVKCPECGEQTYYKEGGCGKCLSCGYSSCG